MSSVPTTALGPNLFVVGAAKAGTTTLHDLLAAHPDVFMSSVKEPHFFSSARDAPNISPIRDEAAYRALFAPGLSTRYRGESSPSYLWDAAAPARIARWTLDAKFVISLRDPVERAFSHYLMDVREGIQSAPFDEALRHDAARSDKGWGVSHLYLELGEYSTQLARYFETFGRRRVHVVFFEDLARDASAVASSLYHFLGLPNCGPIDPRPRNAYGRPRGWIGRTLMGAHRLRGAAHRYLPHRLRGTVRAIVVDRNAPKPELDHETAQRLADHYADEVARLECLLGQSTPWSRWQS